ncbi:1-acyl-sn-glycerol-3-phosphate acyltransferase [Candidatus Giovannonibacteria bacterium]|nr:1-acyl-sn-glycerol-3-phosphate acyltransferase [Candidatus Giovannonibacteria bacterium]
MNKELLSTSLFDIIICGMERVQKLEGPLIVVANHKSIFDSLLFAEAISVNPGLFPLEFCFPENEKEMESALKILEKSGTIFIYPEGEIFKRTGLKILNDCAARLAKESKVLVMPAAIVGFENFSLFWTLVNPKTYWKAYRREKRKIYIVFGPVFYADQNKPVDRITEDIRNRIRDLYINPRIVG